MTGFVPIDAVLDQAFDLLWLGLLVGGLVLLASFAIPAVRRDPRGHLAIGLCWALGGQAYLGAVVLWTNGSQDDAFTGALLAGVWLVLVGGLLAALAAAAAGLGRAAAWPAAAGLAAAAAAAAALAVGPLAVVSVWGAVAALVVAALLALRRPRGAGPPLASGLVAGAAIGLLVALRGPGAWRQPPFGVDVLAATLAAGATVFVVARRTRAHAARPS